MRRKMEIWVPRRVVRELLHVREKERFLEQWRMDATDLRPDDGQARERELVDAILVWLEGYGSADRRWRGPSHYRTLGVGLR